MIVGKNFNMVVTPPRPIIGNELESIKRKIRSDNAAIFIHVPKTAGTAVKWNLEQQGIETYHMADPHPFCMLSIDNVTAPIIGRINRFDINLVVQHCT